MKFLTENWYTTDEVNTMPDKKKSLGTPKSAGAVDAFVEGSSMLNDPQGSYTGKPKGEN